MSRAQGESAGGDAESYKDTPYPAAAVSASMSFRSYFSGSKVAERSAMWGRRIPGLSAPEERQREDVRPSRYANLCRAAAAAPRPWALKGDVPIHRPNLNLGPYKQNVVQGPHIAALGTGGRFLLRDAEITRGERRRRVLRILHIG